MLIDFVLYVQNKCQVKTQNYFHQYQILHIKMIFSMLIVMPYGVFEPLKNDLGAGWWCQAITWTTVDLTHCGLVTPYGDRGLGQQIMP